MRDTATVGYALGAGCTPDEAARFAIYCQNCCQGPKLSGWSQDAQHRASGGQTLSLSDCFEDWHNLTYVRRMEGLTTPRLAS